MLCAVVGTLFHVAAAAAATASERPPLGIDRSSFGASTATWDEAQGTIRHKRSYSAARFASTGTQMIGDPTPEANAQCGGSNLEYAQPIAVGRVGGDALPDIVMGCSRDDSGISDSGTAFYIARRTDNTGWDTPIELPHPSRASGGNARCGYAVRIADVNVDGLGDVLVGCPLRDQGAADAGSIIVFLRNGTDSGFLGATEITAATPTASHQCGQSIAVGNVTGVAGTSDIAFGCAPVAGIPGHVIVSHFNGASFDPPTLVNWAGASTPDRCGVSVDLKDVDGDGRDDIAFGCLMDDHSSMTDTGTGVVRLSTGPGFGAAMTMVHPVPGNSDRCGSAMVLADVDGDSDRDLVMGCSDDNVAAQAGAGSAQVFLWNGSAFVFSTTLLSSTPVAGAECGAYLDVGDTTGDGLPDVVLGCPIDTVGGVSQAGGAIVFARNDANTGYGPGGVRANTSPAPVASDTCGESVALADIDRDGISDIVMGCMQNDAFASNGGSVLVLEGGASPTVVQRSSPTAGEQCGWVTASGDVDGDGRADIVTGCPIRTSNQGGMYVAPWSATRATYHQADGTYFTHTAPANNDYCGWGVAVGDVNGGGRDDVAMGCPEDEVTGSNRGSIMLYTRNVANTGFDPAVTLTNATAADEDHCGISVAIADVTGDGLGDVVAGCPFDSTSAYRAGSVIVFARNDSNDGFEAADRYTNPNGAANDYCGNGTGTGVAAGDLDRDGYAELVVGCHARDAGAVDTGAVLVFPNTGGTFGTPTELVSATARTTDQCGYSVAIGDIDGDGFGDIAAGCDTDDTVQTTGTTTDMGSAVVWLRSGGAYPSSTELNHPAPVTLDSCGQSVALGDTNGDGRDDVLVGCDGDDITVPVTAANAGSALLFARDSANTGFDAPVALTHARPAANDACGNSVMIADATGDGRSDALLGCATDDGNGDSGSVVLLASTSIGAGPGASRVVESRKLNSIATGVTAVTVNVKRLANGAAVPTLEVSANGGASWFSSAIGSPYSFTNSGTDLRIRLTIPAASNQLRTQVIHDISISYDYATPTAGSLTRRVPLAIDRSDVTASTAQWDEQQQVLRQQRAYSPAAFAAADDQFWRAAGPANENCGGSMAFGDANGDSKQDVVMGCADNSVFTGEQHRMVLYTRNVGDTGYDAGFDLTHPSPTSTYGACGTDVALGDVNGDGRDDVLMGCWSDPFTGSLSTTKGTAVLFTRNFANNGFDPAIVYTPDAATASLCGSNVAIADVSGDGKQDMVVGCVWSDVGAADSGGFAVYTRNAANNGFDAVVRVANPNPATNDDCGFSLDVGDVDSDGKVDVLMGCDGDDATVGDAGSVVLFTSYSTGVGFGSNQTYQHPSPAASDICGRSVALADLNADSRADMVFGCPQDDAGAVGDVGSVVYRTRNAANNGFDPAVVLQRADGVASDSCGGAIAVGDLDGDSLPELATGCAQRDGTAANSGSVQVWRHAAASTTFTAGSDEFHAAPSAGEGCGVSVAIGRGDADGRNDLAIGCPYRDITAGDSGGGFIRYSGAPEDLINPSPAMNDQCGFSTSTGDVNGDGLEDVITGCSHSATGQSPATNVAVYVRNATNTGFLPGVELDHPSKNLTDLCGYVVTTGDVNGDGRDDVAAGCPLDDTTGGVDSGSVVVWLRNSANTGFRQGVVYEQPSAGASAQCGLSVALADVDADGRADLTYGCIVVTVSGFAGAGVVVVRPRNAANTSFTTGTVVPNPTPAASEYCGARVAVGDIDGDGYADIASACYGVSSNAGTIAIWTGDANGAFTARPELVPPNASANDLCGNTVEMGDVNGDGLGDVVVTCRDDMVSGQAQAGSAVVFVRNALNTGFLTGVVLSHSAPAAQDYCGWGAGVGDVNGDGRDDVAMGCPLEEATGTNRGAVLVFARDSTNTGFDAPVFTRHVAGQDSDQCGFSMALGDVDADGRSDVAMGCPVDTTTASVQGSVQVFGSTSTGSAGALPRVLESRRLNLQTSGTVSAATFAYKRQVNGAAAPTLEASADGGANWEPATWGAPLTFANPGADLRVRISLPASSNAKLVQTIHDLTMDYVFDDNVAPNAPTPVTPASGSSTNDDTPTLTAQFTDADVPDSGTLQYQVCTVTVSPAQTCTGQGGTLASSGSTAAGITNGASGPWTVPTAIAADTTYYWRVRARDDSGVWGAWAVSQTLTVNSRIIVGVTSGTIALGPVSGGGDVVGSTSVTVDSNDPQGYQLLGADQDAAWGMQCDNAPQCGSTTIPDRTASGAAPLTWSAGISGADGYVGVTVRDTTGATTNRLGKWGAPNINGWPEYDFGNNLFVGLGTSTTTLHQVAALAPSDTVLLSARVTPSIGGTPTAAGSYSGTITVTAVGL